MSLIEKIFSSGIVGDYFLNGTNETLGLVLFIISVAVVIIAAYLLGSINFAIIISGKKSKQDIRDHGSKNAGMTNMMRTYGKKAAGLTLLGDALKAVAACLVGYVLIGSLGAYIAGLFCILGHIFPIFYKFKGGKGVVTTAVAILMCNPLVFVVLFLLFVIIVLFTRYISLGSVVCVMLYPLLLDSVSRIFTGHPTPYVVFAMITAVVVVVKHWGNIKRLAEGKESKFSFKKSVKAPEEKTEQPKEENKEDK
ncbi:MAG: glycerol-3-phosphate 1-O-acyltransferase PlsY [Clostridia bacterium]|nr:glycerol-3-phosphate 1-O-acyltransferase PlsY [Clostridia bacterium]